MRYINCRCYMVDTISNKYFWVAYFFRVDDVESFRSYVNDDGRVCDDMSVIFLGVGMNLLWILGLRICFIIVIQYHLVTIKNG